MTQEPMERDAALAQALAEADANPMDEGADWTALRRATNTRAATELANRRVRRRLRVALPASVAAGIALFVLVARAPDQRGVSPASPRTTASGITIEEILDDSVSDGQVRALLAGARDVDALLLIAAEEAP